MDTFVYRFKYLIEFFLTMQLQYFRRYDLKINETFKIFEICFFFFCDLRNVKENIV